MDSIGNGEYKNEIEEEVEVQSNGKRMTLGDYIPIYIPTVEKGLLNQSRHEKRFLDFLRAHPSRDWFLKSGFVGRFSPFTFLRRDVSPETETSPADAAPRAGSGRRFRVPFVRKINWRGLIRSFKKWIKNPANIAVFIWLVFVVAGLILLALVMLGILNGAIPSSSRRKRWIEVINQILNAFFMIMCLYQHPKIFHHLALLLRWKSSDRAEMRSSYCKDGARRPNERAHMMFVVLLLHITCLSQYVLCGLYWGFSRTARPDWAVNIAIGVGIVAPIVAGVYTVKSPLGKRYDSEADEEPRRQVTPAAVPDQSELERLHRRVVVTSPEWIGGLFDCWDDLTVACSSFFCTFCVFGWNAERLGFGNMYVHIFTFILLCIAPFLVFSAAGLSIDDYDIRYIVGIIGIVLCFFGLLYGGYWRIQMRKRFKLPGNPYCCGDPSVTDCLAWQFCWSCALAQEVRTANFYDIEDDSFYTSVRVEDGQQVLHPLPREGGSGVRLSPDAAPRSHSWPSKIRPVDQPNRVDMSNGLPTTMERARTYGESHVMAPPLPPLIQLEDHRH